MSVELQATDLLSKWGFGDGDLLWDWAHDNLGDDLDPDVYHPALRALVRKHLIPAIEAAGHTVDAFDIWTIHNPIRTGVLNGEPVDNRRPTAQQEAALGDIAVTVSADEIRAAIEAAS